jgi:hypothetical protein
MNNLLIDTFDYKIIIEFIFEHENCKKNYLKK